MGASLPSISSASYLSPGSTVAAEAAEGDLLTGLLRTNFLPVFFSGIFLGTSSESSLMFFGADLELIPDLGLSYFSFFIFITSFLFSFFFSYF